MSIVRESAYEREEWQRLLQTLPSTDEEAAKWEGKPRQRLTSNVPQPPSESAPPYHLLLPKMVRLLDPKSVTGDPESTSYRYQAIVNLTTCLNTQDPKQVASAAALLEARLATPATPAPKTRRAWLDLFDALPLAPEWRLFLRQLVWQTAQPLAPVMFEYYLRTEEGYSECPSDTQERRLRPRLRLRYWKVAPAEKRSPALEGAAVYRFFHPSSIGALLREGERAPVKWEQHSDGKWYGVVRVREVGAIIAAFRGPTYSTSTYRLATW